MNNRLPGRGRDRYNYNEWGELTGRRGQQLEWNAQGQLMRVISSNTETHYRYDALGRRVSKATYGRHTGHTEQSRTEFVWEGFRLLQENVPHQGWRTYLYDAEQPYTPVACVTGKGENRQVWYYHTDVTGTAQEVTSADGKRVWAGYLAAWGEKRADISNSGAYFHQPLRLPGQYFDDETGLHYNLFRYYAPESGRFISQDPIGLAGGLNLYSYAPNPLTWFDPLGLSDDKINVYKDAPYHGASDNSVKSRAPTNGQTALDNSVQVKPTSPRRVGVDIANNEIVVLDKTRSLTDNIDEYHGHVRDWDALDNKQQSELTKSGKTTRKGKVCGG